MTFTWKFIPRLSDAYSWNTRPYRNYTSVTEISNVIQPIHAKNGGIVEILKPYTISPNKSDMQWEDETALHITFRTTTSLKETIAKCVERNLTIKSIYIYDLGYFIK